MKRDKTEIVVPGQPWGLTAVKGHSVNFSCAIMMGNSVCKPINDTVQHEYPNTSMPVPFALRSVLAVYWRVPNDAPACTRVRYNISDIAVTEDPESTKNSTEWSQIHPSKNQCPVPEICITGSSHRNGSSFMVGVTGSVSADSSPS